MNKQNTLLVHSVICIVALAAAGVGCTLLKLPASATEGICSLVALVLVSTGMMTAASTASTQATAQALASDTNAAIAALEAQHAVHSAQISAMSAQPVTLSIPSSMLAPSVTEAIVNPPAKGIGS